MSQPASQPIRITDFKTLVEECAAQRVVKIQLRGKTLEILIRPLCSEELSAAQAIVNSVLPPRKPVPYDNPVTRQREMRDGFDYEDADYKKKSAQAEIERRAFILDLGLVELHAEGEKLSDKAKWFETKLPNAILRALVDQITTISDGDLQVVNSADFFSESDSTALPS